MNYSKIISTNKTISTILVELSLFISDKIFSEDKPNMTLTIETIKFTVIILSFIAI